MNNYKYLYLYNFKLYIIFIVQPKIVGVTDFKVYMCN